MCMLQWFVYSKQNKRPYDKPYLVTTKGMFKERGEVFATIYSLESEIYHFLEGYNMKLHIEKMSNLKATHHTSFQRLCERIFENFYLKLKT